MCVCVFINKIYVCVIKIWACINLYQYIFISACLYIYIYIYIERERDVVKDTERDRELVLHGLLTNSYSRLLPVVNLNLTLCPIYKVKY